MHRFIFHHGLSLRLAILLAGGVAVLVGMTLPSTCHAQGKTEIVEIDHAQARVDVPENWNHSLVVYCHGYTMSPVKFEKGELNPVLQVFLKHGYAVVQSGYSGGGWAISEAVHDIEKLRGYFSEHYGAPKETYITGHSMGGFLTVVIMEQNPGSYAGGLPLCGPLARPSWFMGRRVFDFRVVFDYYFPGVFPSPVNMRPDYEPPDNLSETIKKLLESNPEKAESLRRFAGNHTNDELISNAIFFTYILLDLQNRAGGNLFDNRNIIYEGTLDDGQLNTNVARYASNLKAKYDLDGKYVPMGNPTHPMVAIRTNYDPMVPAWVSNSYSSLLRDSGLGLLFVQQYVKRDGHCAITPDEVAKGFDELVRWVHEGTPPAPGLLQ